MVGMTWAVAAALGPVLGGGKSLTQMLPYPLTRSLVFTEDVTWRWCFYINLPCDGLAFVILLLFLDIETPKTPVIAGLKAIDWTGSLTIAGGTVMLLLGLAFGGVSHPWNSVTVICLIVFGIVVIIVFFFNEAKFPAYPVMPLRLFKRRSNVACLAVCFCHGFTFISGSIFLPLYYQSTLGASPILSGVYLFPYVIPLALASAVTGVFIRKTGQYQPPIWFGMFFMTLGFGLYLDLPPYASWPRIIIFQIISGIGVGPNFQAPLIALQSGVSPGDIATATATFGFVRNLATSISAVIGSVIFQNQMAQKRAMLEAALPHAIAEEITGGAAGAVTALVAALPPDQKEVANRAYTDSLQMMWVVYVCVGALGFTFSLLIRKQQLSRTHHVTKTGLEAAEETRKQAEREKAAHKMERRSMNAGSADSSSSEAHRAIQGETV